ncbi:hypothetical protein EDB89DRAFT_428823 [Lactarius sanguifluus]|nr:hypothetical protein EDB89DRAFT_428823 [Lactarius sanguifluus]
MIMSNMPHTNRLVKALVTHVNFLDPLFSDDPLIACSSILFSMMRMRMRKWIKSTTMTSLTNLSLRKKKRLKPKQSPQLLHKLSECAFVLVVLAPFVTSLLVVVTSKYLLLFQSSTHLSTLFSLCSFRLNSLVTFRAAWCTFTTFFGLSAFDSLDHNFPS